MEKRLSCPKATAGLGKYGIGDYGQIGHCTTLELRTFCK